MKYFIPEVFIAIGVSILAIMLVAFLFDPVKKILCNKTIWGPGLLGVVASLARRIFRSVRIRRAPPLIIGSVMKKKKLPRVHRRKLIPFKWLGTVLCTIGIALTSFNIYPLNIFVMFVGTMIWFIVGTLQKDWPLATGELISVILYFSGILFFIINIFIRQ